jgi:predicted Holliday junction resolvase-like endonuclease
MEEFSFHYPDSSDMIQQGDFVIILLASLAIFVLIQLMNGIMNILTARFMKKRAQLEEQVREDEARLMAEQWEDVIVKFSEIMEKTLDLEEKLDYIIENIDVYKPETIVIPKKRGKYKPRQPKGLEHKKTPPES